MHRVASLAFLCLLASGFAPTAHAQFHRATDAVASPAASLVLHDDALAVDLDPAAIGRLPGLSGAFVHSEVNAQDSWLARGDAIYLATPVIGPLSFGVTFQSIRPGARALPPAGTGRGNRGMAGLALALAPSSGVSFGVSMRGFSSSDPRFDGLGAFDASVLLRPSRFLSIGLTARDLFASHDGQGTSGLDIAPSVQLSLGMRPLPTDLLTLSGDLVSRLEGPAPVGARGGLGVRIPWVGTAAGLVEVEHLGDRSATLRVMAELSVSAGPMSLGGGVLVGDGFGHTPGVQVIARVDQVPRPGLPIQARMVSIELPELSSRGMIALALALERVRTDDRIAGVLLRPRSSGIGMAYAQELRTEIAALRAAGKRVVCHLDSATGSEYYACAGADRVVLDPAGDIRLMGVSTTTIVFGEALDKLGIRADFIRIGAYKSAPEQYTQKQLSDAAKEQMNALVDDAQRRMLADLSADLRISDQRAGELIDAGPYLAHAAMASHLVGEIIDENDLDASSTDLLGGHALAHEFPSDQDYSWGRMPSIGVVVVDDEMVDGESVEIPLLGLHRSGSETIIRELEELGRDPTIRAVVLRVDSPGGAALGADKIWRAVRRLREHKPVIASMGALAASGGYYIASAADEIWADPATLTGSIGIFYGKVDVEQLADKLGVHVESFERGAHAGSESLFRPFTGDERAGLAEMLREYYRLFLSRVAEGRRMSADAVDAVARGRVYSGDSAQRLGLVDRLGGFASALVRAQQLVGLGPTSGVVVRPKRKSGLLDYVLGGVVAPNTPLGEAGASLNLNLPHELRALLRMAVMLPPGAGPLALLPFDAQL